MVGVIWRKHVLTYVVIGWLNFGGFGECNSLAAVRRPSVCPIARHSNGGWRVALQLSTLWQEISIDRLAAGAMRQASELSSKANSVMLRRDEGGSTQIMASVGSELLWSISMFVFVCLQASTSPQLKVSPIFTNFFYQSRPSSLWDCDGRIQWLSRTFLGQLRYAHSKRHTSTLLLYKQPSLQKSQFNLK